MDDVMILGYPDRVAEVAGLYEAIKDRRYENRSWAWPEALLAGHLAERRIKVVFVCGEHGAVRRDLVRLEGCLPSDWDED